MAMRVCTACGEAKPHTTTHFHRAGKGRLHGRCKECRTAEARAKYRENPDVKRDARLRARYGITASEYEQLLLEQGGVCKVCGHDPGPEGFALHVDHDHASGAVRGLLCQHCNIALGMAKEDPARLRGLLEYIGSISTPTTEMLTHQLAVFSELEAAKRRDPDLFKIVFETPRSLTC